MKDNPQLSAEMEKRYNAIMLEWIKSQWKIEQAHQARKPYTRMKFEADASKVEDKLKHFLATALEEQRMKVEVETGLHAFGVTMEEIAKARADERKKVIEEIATAFFGTKQNCDHRYQLSADNKHYENKCMKCGKDQENIFCWLTDEDDRQKVRNLLDYMKTKKIELSKLNQLKGGE